MTRWHRYRWVRWLALFTSLAVLGGLLVAGVLRNEPPRPRPVSPEAAELVESQGALDRDARVVAAGGVQRRTARFVGSGHTVAADGKDPVRLPALRDTARLVVGYDSSGHATAAGIQVPLGERRGDPLSVDYRETAFARLVTIPPYATDDPRELLILRGLAEQSPHLDALAERMREHAARDPRTFWTEPDRAEAREIALLASDIARALADAVPLVRPSGFSGEPTIRLAAFEQVADYHACAPSDVFDGFPHPPLTPGTATGLCLFPQRHADGSYEVEAVNHGPSWAFVFTAAPVPGSGAPIAAVRPHTREWPGLQDLALSLGKDIVSAGPRLALNAACRGMRWLSGRDCAEDLTELSAEKLFASLHSKWGNINQTGKMSFHLTAEEAKHPLGVGTGGLAPPLGPTPAGAAPDLLTSPSTLALTCSVVSQVVAPTISLIIGTRLPLASAVRNPRSPRGELILGEDGRPGKRRAPRDTLGTEPRGNGDVIIGEPGAPGKHRGPTNKLQELEDPLHQAFTRVRGNGELEQALADIRSGDPVLIVPGAARFVALLAASPELLSAVLALVFPGGVDWFTSQLAEVARSLGVVAVPGLGWLRALDLAVKGVGLMYGAWKFVQDLPRITTAQWLGPVVPPPAPPQEPPPPQEEPPPPQEEPPPPPEDTSLPEPPAAIDWSEIVRLDCSQAVGGPLVEVAAEADVTGDGVDEVFLVSECEASTSSWPQVLSVYDVAGADGPVRLQTLLGYEDGNDDRGLRDIYVAVAEGDTLTVTSSGYEPTDGNCCPSVPLVDSWTWDGTSYVRQPRELNIGD